MLSNLQPTSQLCGGNFNGHIDDYIDVIVDYFDVNDDHVDVIDDGWSIYHQQWKYLIVLLSSFYVDCSLQEHMRKHKKDVQGDLRRKKPLEEKVKNTPGEDANDKW